MKGKAILPTGRISHKDTIPIKNIIVVFITVIVFLAKNESETIPTINVPIVGLKIFIYENTLDAGFGYSVAKTTPRKVDNAPKYGPRTKP